MKNAYLNSVFISRLYLRTIKKNIVDKTKKRWKKKIIKYIESQYIPFKLLKMKIKLQIEITRKKQEMFWNEGKRKNRWNKIEKKMNWRGSRWEL